jgi:hypothetical protein
MRLACGWYVTSRDRPPDAASIPRGVCWRHASELTPDDFVGYSLYIERA